MRTRDVEDRYGIDHFEFENFLKAYNLEYSTTILGDWIVEDALIEAYVCLFLDVKAENTRKANVLEEENNEFAWEERKRVRDLLEEQKEYPVFKIEGCRGRKITVYRDRCIIKTDVTLGAILSDNATDGEKTIFYKDIIGIQYKASGLLIGYLQLETASNQMNNSKSNMFGENTFTFEKNMELVEEMKDYIIYQVSLHKKP